MTSTGFHATEMWRDMIGILHEQVSVKNRRHLLKSYSGVFTGSNAVDVLFGHKQMRPDLFTDNTTRENIVRLCQRFLESRVFFPAKQDLQNQIRYEKFEDSNTSFYRFNPDGNYLGAPEAARTPFQDMSNASNRTTQNHSQQRANSEPDLTRVDCNMECSFSSPDRCHQSYSPSSTGITKHFSFMRKQRTRNLAFSGFSGHVVENNHAKEETDPFDDELDSKIERECVRVRLLQLLDLQFVEGFVCSPSAGQTQGITKASRPLVDVLRFHSLFNSSLDPWIKRAIDVMQHIPDAENHLNQIKNYSSNRKKVLLFEVISAYYTRLQQPLISSQWDEVINAIQSLINEQRDSSEALQLFLRLISNEEREELHHLFSFLYIVQVSGNVVLSDRYTNDVVVRLKFSTTIFPSCGQVMLKACLDRINDAFTLPENIQKQIHTKIQLLRAGQIESPNVRPDYLFASQINSSEFQRQRSEGTNIEVLKLIKDIENNPNFTIQRKNELISSLKSQHPNAGTSLV